MILITGAAGYIGRALIARFEQLNIPFRATDLAGHLPIYPSKTPIEILDVRDFRHWSHSLKDIRTVIHLAAESYIGRCENNPNEAMLTNLSSIQLMLQAVKASGVRKIIFPSSFAVYGPQAIEMDERAVPKPNNLYAHMKLWAEQLLMHAGGKMGIDVIIFRQSNICGRGPLSKLTVVQALVEKWKEKSAMTIHGAGHQIRNFLDIRDCAEAYLAAVNASKGGVYNLGGPSTVSINDIAEKINEVGLQVGGYQVPIIHQALDKPGQEAEPEEMECNFDRVEAELGFKPRYTIEDTIRQLMEYEEPKGRDEYAES